MLAGSAVDAPKVVQVLPSVSCQSDPLHGGSDASEAMNVDVPQCFVRLAERHGRRTCDQRDGEDVACDRVREWCAACFLDVEHVQAVVSGGRPRRDGEVLPVVECLELPAEGVAGPIGLGQSGGLEISQADEVDRHAAIELRLEGEGPCRASIVDDGDGGCAARVGLRLAA